MDYETFIEDSYQGRIRLLELLGCTSVADAEYELRKLVNKCLDDIKITFRDLPEPQNYDSSRNSSSVKTPSQSLSRIETELKELVVWFNGGRRPRLRGVISSYTVSAMLGRPPFGGQWIAATPHTATYSRHPKYFPQRGKYYFFDILSSDETIRQGQIALYSQLRTASGNSLALAIGQFQIHDSVAIFRHFDGCRKLPNGHFLLKDLEASIPKSDFPLMAAIAEHARNLISNLRRGYDEKNKSTVAKWSRQEPGFGLVLEMLETLWPLEKGVCARVRVKDDFRTAFNILEDLAVNLVELAQKKIDFASDFRGKNFEKIRKPFSFLGERGVDSIPDMFSLVVNLRTEFLAYSIALDTLNNICDSALQWANDRLNCETNLVCQEVLPNLDRRIAARRQFLNFGADRLRGSNFKWCGRLDPYARQRWGREGELVSLVFPVRSFDQNRLLALFDDLVGSFALTQDVVRAWSTISAWARTEGRDHWKGVLEPVPDFRF